MSMLQRLHDRVEIGVITGTFVAAQFPNKPCVFLRFKASPENTGKFWLGHDADSLLWELASGDDTGWIEDSNLDRYWSGKTSGSTDRLVYWLQT